MSTTVPFKQTFKTSADRQLQRDDEDPEQHGAENENIKKRPRSSAPSYREVDAEVAGKKDRPPSFSTVFAPAPAPIPVSYEPEPRSEKTRKGVWIPRPWFILLAIIFCFMLAFILGLGALVLYKIVWYGFSHSPAPIDACNCADKGIQIAPNFVMGGKETTTVTVTASQTSTTSSTTSPTTTAKPSTTTSVVLFTPPPSIIHSTKLVAVDENGNTITLTGSTKSARSAKSTSLNSAEMEASIASKMSSIKSALHPTGTITEIHTSSTPTPGSTKDKPSTTGSNDTTKTDDADVGQGTNPACLGGNDNGAAMHCP